ncbi:Holo-[acyl-carrier protein] synthase (EC [uncultured Gammaproteobacteria bacterium]|jgi:holo-[acyl-carrier protein] synthase|uniref:holo-ACP synthase n=1 Tax=thiotrophic endosymbiont of Bathymodiolus puteoserpentis (Logatchev) TaxID=343240 RepID=UPI0010B5DC34|nr:holo-ACP synthase [thiotrophic endosymbiont of Bathymodiolus puteoserpentis (Logatchev)]CAC9500947.1 Holo-[acyl-carrier-protein] synthase (EC 2.7.8.7) [uncultured Gammaproteobacteria bacterium]CAC9506706.1 Holo-[acyl-carrier-protein] synthase (EC 2.7.8.7) [uncultured Gammaproteobacteria bacterium]CAC9587712.1 Holo-[acyl-carrier-protein] synthase (EC 2.7.8.7) [uncultured Gammaproteobacteria bacterium]CAC9659846.1 Holo-[acyl-carrier-protein] synthase (EC 2.7.8.7) [uncultured Gammaproteobacteri
MIYGIGTDIINIERVEQILNKNKDGFVHRVLSEHEQALFANKGDSAAYCAKRFAAKEAFAKALGTGIGRIVSFQDLTIRNNEEGKPYFIPSEKLRLYLVDRNIKQAHLSLSDEKFNAVAFVVLELGKKNEAEKGEYGTTF